MNVNVTFHEMHVVNLGVSDDCQKRLHNGNFVYKNEDILCIKNKKTPKWGKSVIEDGFLHENIKNV